VHSGSDSAVETVPSSTPGSYVGCLRDRLWWIGSVRSVSDEHDDYEVVFMHPHGPSRYFRWPQREDICWVPRVHVLGKVLAPSTATGRSYKISAEDSAAIETSFKKAINKM